MLDKIILEGDLEEIFHQLGLRHKDAFLFWYQHYLRQNIETTDESIRLDLSDNFIAAVKGYSQAVGISPKDLIHYLCAIEKTSLNGNLPVVWLTIKNNPTLTIKLVTDTITHSYSWLHPKLYQLKSDHIDSWVLVYPGLDFFPLFGGLTKKDFVFSFVTKTSYQVESGLAPFFLTLWDEVILGKKSPDYKTFKDYQSMGTVGLLLLNKDQSYCLEIRGNKKIIQTCSIQDSAYYFNSLPLENIQGEDLFFNNLKLKDTLIFQNDAQNFKFEIKFKQRQLQHLPLVFPITLDITNDGISLLIPNVKGAQSYQDATLAMFLGDEEKAYHYLQLAFEENENSKVKLWIQISLTCLELRHINQKVELGSIYQKLSSLKYDQSYFLDSLNMLLSYLENKLKLTKTTEYNFITPPQIRLDLFKLY